MVRIFTRMLSLFVLAALAPPAFADDQPFLNVDTTAVAAAGETDLQQWLGWANGHAGESFNQFESVSEIDYGLSNRAQLAASAEFALERTRQGALPARTDGFAGLSCELVYLIVPPDQAGFGAAFSLEGALSVGEREIALRALFQRAFLDGAVLGALDIGVAQSWEKNDDGWSRASALQFDLGIACPLDPQWTVALEFDNEHGFDGLVFSGPQVSNTFFLGPTIQYAAPLGVVTFGFQAQLPWADASEPDAGKDGYIADAERFRLALRLTRAL